VLKLSSKLGLQFEDEVRQFLKDLEFERVNGGKSFYLNKKQVDAIAGHEDTLLVIECSTKKRLKEVINEYRGKIESLKEGLRNHADYKKYRNLRFIVATNRRRISVEDINAASEKPRIYLWDGHFKTYYYKLFKVIGKYAKYNALAEFDVEPAKKSRFETVALKTDIRGYKVYQFLADPKRLLEFSFVARRERGNEQYYQRFIKNQRLKEVVDFIDRKRGIFPTSIVVSIERPKFTKQKKLGNVEVGTLKFPEKYRSCWIIDGQHRLYSFSHSASTIQVPVFAFANLKLEKHARFFLEINGEQQRVPPDLLWDLEGVLAPNEPDGVISRICKKLNEGDGPLSGRIYIPIEGFGGEKKKKLKFSGLCQTIQNARLVEKYSATLIPAKGTNPLYVEDTKKRVNKSALALNKYFDFIDQNFEPSQKEDFVYTNGGISVMIYLFERLLAGLRRIPRNNDLSKYLPPVKEYLSEIGDLSTIIDRCNSEGGRKGVLQDFLTAIFKKTNDKAVCAGIEPVDVQKKVIQFEPAVRGFVKKVLLTKCPTDWSTRIPKDVIETVFKRHGKSLPDPMFFDDLTLGECEKIMRTSGNADIFRKLLINPEYGFSEIDEVWVFYHILLRFRNPTAHGKEVELKYRDEDFILLIIDKFKKTFEQDLS